MFNCLYLTDDKKVVSREKGRLFVYARRKAIIRLRMHTGRLHCYIIQSQGRIQTGFRGVCVGGGGGSVETPFDLKFQFHWKFWINWINLGHFSLCFSSTSPFYYL